MIFDMPNLNEYSHPYHNRFHRVINLYSGYAMFILRMLLQRQIALRCGNSALFASFHSPADRKFQNLTPANQQSQTLKSVNQTYLNCRTLSDASKKLERPSRVNFIEKYQIYRFEPTS